MRAFRSALFTWLAVTVLAACGAGGAVPPSANAVLVPQARLAATAAASSWKIFPISGVFATSGGAAASTNALWFTARGTLVKMTPAGTYQTFALPGDFDPTALATGSNGNVYTTACCTLSGDYAVLITTPAGATQSFVPASQDGVNDGLAADRSGNMWFTEFAHVAKITASGSITEYPLSLPNGLLSNNVESIALGSDGRMWFPINNNNESPYNGYLAAIDPSNGNVTQYPVPCFDPEPVVSGDDGNLYAGCRVPFSTKVNILRMSTSGATKVITDPYGMTFGGNILVAVPTGIFFVTFTGGAHPDSLGFLNTSNDRIVDVVQPSSAGDLSALVHLPGGRLWALSANEDALEYFAP